MKIEKKSNSGTEMVQRSIEVAVLSELEKQITIANRSHINLKIIHRALREFSDVVTADVLSAMDELEFDSMLGQLEHHQDELEAALNNASEWFASHGR